MPNRYLEKISNEGHIPMAELEAYWNQAKARAKEQGVDPKKFYAYVMTIFKNLASVNGVSVEEAFQSISRQVEVESDIATGRDFESESKGVVLPEWWMRLSQERQKAYLKLHPRSKFAQYVGKRGKPTAKVGGKKPAGGKKPPATRARPRKVSELRSKSQKSKGIWAAAKQVASNLLDKGRKAMAKQLNAHKATAKAAKDFITGKRKLSANEKEHVKSWVATAAKLTVAAIAVGSLFTPLAGFAPEIADKFMQVALGDMYSTAADDEFEVDEGEVIRSQLEEVGDEEFSHRFLEVFQNWLLDQDPTALVEEFKGGSDDSSSV